MANARVDKLLHSHKPISEQVSTEQLRVILTELDTALDHNPTGSIVEFGCYTGTTSLFIRRLLDARHEKRAFHVYDSFEGLPTKTAADQSPAGGQFQAGELSVSKKQFLRNFAKANLDPPMVHKAWFSDLSAADVPDNICFAFLDGDFYQSIRDSLNLVLPKMATGSCLIVDDYAREALPGCAKAVCEQLPHLGISTTENMAVIHIS